MFFLRPAWEIHQNKGVKRMIPPELKAKIRRLHFAEHWKVGTIAAQMDLVHEYPLMISLLGSAMVGLLVFVVAGVIRSMRL
jgi:hypothetical protein